MSDATQRAEDLLAAANLKSPPCECPTAFGPRGHEPSCTSRHWWKQQPEAMRRVRDMSFDTLRVAIMLAEALLVAPCEQTGLYTRRCDGENCQHCPALAEWERLL